MPWRPCHIGLESYDYATARVKLLIIVLWERGSAGGAAGTGGYNANGEMKIAQCYGLVQWCRMAGRGRMFWPRLARLVL